MVPGDVVPSKLTHALAICVWLTEPVGPVAPVWPAGPVDPVAPVWPAGPVAPVAPALPPPPVVAIDIFALPSKEAEPVTLPVNAIVLAVASFVDVDAFPERVAVIVPELKFPLASRRTMEFARFVVDIGLNTFGVAFVIGIVFYF